MSYIGVVEAEFGDLQRGTFVIAKKSDGKTNSHMPSDAITVLEDLSLEFRGSSAFQPMNPDKTSAPRRRTAPRRPLAREERVTWAR